MTQEEKDKITEEANRRYPIGTKFRNYADGSTMIVTSKLYFMYDTGPSHVGIKKKE